jgi:SsrA-binding protein
MKTLITNRKAKFDYEYLQEYEVGIVLFGSEVKAIRDGKVSIVDAFCYIKDNEMFIKNFRITTESEFFGHSENRDKKLLLHKSEIRKIQSNLTKGLTLIPFWFYLTDSGKIKCRVAIARGKKNYDKRETIKKRDTEREIKKLVKI